MLKVKIILIVLYTGIIGYASAQYENVYTLSDPASMRSRAPLDLESYFFHAGEQFYAARLGFLYGLQNERHLLGISIPFVHNIFVGDYAGFENTTGIGDIKMMYMGVPYYKKDKIGLSRISAAMEISTPTGEWQLGRGAGVWTYKPGLTFTYRLAPEIFLYPEIGYQFSLNKANSTGGSGMPDPEDPEKDNPIQNLKIKVPAVIVIDSWEGWFSLNGQYLRSFSAKEDYFFIGMDLGKMLGERSSASLNISKFIAGQPRLNVLVAAKFLFLIGS